MNCAAEVRDFSQIIDWKTGVVFGNITPAKRLETLTGLAGNNDRREQLLGVQFACQEAQVRKATGECEHGKLNVIGLIQFV